MESIHNLCEDVKELETSSCAVMYHLRQGLQQPDMNYMSYIGVLHTNDEIIPYIHYIWAIYTLWIVLENSENPDI